MNKKPWSKNSFGQWAIFVGQALGSSSKWIRKLWERPPQGSEKAVEFENKEYIESLMFLGWEQKTSK